MAKGRVEMKKNNVLIVFLLMHFFLSCKDTKNNKESLDLQCNSGERGCQGTEVWMCDEGVKLPLVDCFETDRLCVDGQCVFSQEYDENDDAKEPEDAENAADFDVLFQDNEIDDMDVVLDQDNIFSDSNDEEFSDEDAGKIDSEENDNFDQENPDYDDEQYPDVDEYSEPVPAWAFISAGYYHSCGISVDDHKLYCWGNIDLGTSTPKWRPVKINDDAWFKVSVGHENTCAIKEINNALFCWGDNTHGTLGDGSTVDRLAPVRIGDDEWIAVTTGEHHTCGIKADNSLYCWGRGVDCELGDGVCSDYNQLTPKKIGNDSWITVSVGGKHTCGIKNSNKLFCWGWNNNGQVGDGTDIVEKKVPTQIGSDSWLSVGAGEDHTCGIKQTDGKLYCWGLASNGRLGTGASNDDVLSPTKVNDSVWSSLAVGTKHTCAITTSGALYCWGYNEYGQVGNGTTVDRATPVRIGSATWSSVTAGVSHTCGIRSTDSKVYCWGNNVFSQLADGVNRSIPQKIGTAKWDAVKSGNYHSCAINAADNTLYCWGDNISYQIGTGSEASEIIVPTKVGTLTWHSLAMGVAHSCAIRLTDKSLYCWGWNDAGQTGNGFAGNNIKTPAKIGSSVWSAITAGAHHSCGITADNNLYCWGDNEFGQLGDGTTTDKAVPTSIGTELWLDLIAGRSHTCAITKKERHLYCWGLNDKGQLGDGTTTNKNVPTKIGNEAWVGLSGGEYHTCGIKLSDSKMYCWGSNSKGQIGNGGAIGTSITTPVLVSGDIIWSTTAAGRSHTCGISSYLNFLFCWGVNSFYSILGDGTNIHRNTPRQIGSDEWLSITGGASHSCGIKKCDNGLYCWGANDDGQLGDNGMRKTSPQLMAGQ